MTSMMYCGNIFDSGEDLSLQMIEKYKDIDSIDGDYGLPMACEFWYIDGQSYSYWEDAFEGLWNKVFPEFPYESNPECIIKNSGEVGVITPADNSIIYRKFES